MLKTDAELLKTNGITSDTLRAKAAEILAQFTPHSALADSPKPKKTSKKAKKPKVSETNRSLSHSLFEAYRQSEDNLNRSAIAYLLKNGCKLTDKEEDPEKFAKRRRRVEIQIQRLIEQLVARMPKGRDLTNARWLETLAIASTTFPENEAQPKSWQDRLLKQPVAIPFPLAYETNEGLNRFKDNSNRLCVKFNGLSEHSFQIYCDRRQILWFNRFLEDQQIKQTSKNQHSSSLFTLRSGRIAWQEGEGKSEPWNVHRLTLYCTVDTPLWTAEGTEQVKQEKAAEIAKILTKTKEKGNLNENQQAFIQRKNSTLAPINNPFPRPSQALYQGQTHILLGVSLGLEKPASIAIVDAIASKPLTYRSVKQLLGKKYHLLNRQRQKKQRTSQQRHSAQKQAAPNRFGESELGEYVDRLLLFSVQRKQYQHHQSLYHRQHQQHSSLFQSQRVRSLHKFLAGLLDNFSDQKTQNHNPKYWLHKLYRKI